MADNVKKYGFRWSISGNGKPLPEPIEYVVADAYQATIDGGGTNVGLSIGDPVKQVSTGTVALANAGDAIFGIIVGFGPRWDGYLMQPTNYLPGATTGGGINERLSRVYVVPASLGLWEVDCDDKTTATTEAAYRALIHQTCDHACPGDTSNASFPKANPMLDISTQGTGSAQWKIVRIGQTVENQDFSGLYVKLIVKVSETQESPWLATGV